MTAHLILTLDAPMMSFGGETIDNYGVVRDFPARSMLTGLLANALGWDRSEGERLDTLQSRIDFAALRLREGRRRQDYQTARLFEKDAGWTTRDAPEGRAPSPSFSWDLDWEGARGVRTKSLTHQRYRSFDADALVLVAMSLSGDGAPSLAAAAEAFAKPERPLFIGRKPFLPSRPICSPHLAEAPSSAHALFWHLARMGWQGAAPASWSPDNADTAGSTRELGEVSIRLQNPENRVDALLRGALGTHRRERIADERRHRTGVHGGSRDIALGEMTVALDPMDGSR